MTFHIGHRQVRDRSDLAEIVDANHVLVRDLTRQEQLAFEPPLAIVCTDGIPQRLWSDDLQRHDDPKLIVPRLVDDAHATAAEQSDDSVPGSEGVSWAEYSDTRHVRERRRGC